MCFLYMYRNNGLMYTPNEINVCVGVCKHQNDKVSLTFTYEMLRKLKNDGDFCSYVKKINEYVKHVKLHPSECLETHLSNKSSRLSSEYKNIKGGNNKSKFDKKLNSITAFATEIELLFPSVNNCASSQALLTNDVRIDHSSSMRKSRVVKKMSTQYR